MWQVIGGGESITMLWLSEDYDQVCHFFQIVSLDCELYTPYLLPPIELGRVLVRVGDGIYLPTGQLDSSELVSPEGQPG